MKEQILQLRAEGKSYRQIQAILGCSRGTISYHCGSGQKDKKRNRQRRNRSQEHPFTRKVENFICNVDRGRGRDVGNTKWRQLIYQKILMFCSKTKKVEYMSFTVEDVLNKFGENPKCYLTGDPVDIYQPRTYHFDHKIPRTRGGDSTIDNLGICTKEANMAKHDMTPEEFYELCQKVVDNKPS